MRGKFATARRIVRGVLLRMCLAVALVTGRALAGAESLRAVAEIRFYGTSTLHDFRGRAVVQPFLMTRVDGPGAEPSRWSAEAEVRVADMTTAQRDRDRNMLRMFEADRYPTIRAVVENATIPTNGPARVEGRFRIRDRERMIPVIIRDWKEDADGVSFRATFEISLASFGLNPPSLLGILRVGDRVRVEADVNASAGKPPASQSVNPP